MRLYPHQFSGFQYHENAFGPSPFIMRTLEAHTPLFNQGGIVEAGMHTGANAHAVAGKYPNTPFTCFDINPTFVNRLKGWAKKTGVNNLSAFTGNLLDPRTLLKKITHPIAISYMGDGVAGHIGEQDLCHYFQALWDKTVPGGSHLASVIKSKDRSPLLKINFNDAAVVENLGRYIAHKAAEQGLPLGNELAAEMAQGLAQDVLSRVSQAKSQGVHPHDVSALRDTLKTMGYAVDVLPYNKIKEPLRVDLKWPVMMQQLSGPNLIAQGSVVDHEISLTAQNLMYLKITKPSSTKAKSSKQRAAASVKAKKPPA